MWPGQNSVDANALSTMLSHYNAGFTLSAYVHATRQMQENAAAKMGDIVSQAM